METRHLSAFPTYRSAGYQPPPLHVIKAAVNAMRAGQFDGTEHEDLLLPAAVQVAAATEPRGSARPSPPDLGAPAVLVLAGHAGAGASTVALALAEALSGRWRVQLVEYSEPRRSGLGAASPRELGVDAAGWRRGRRGALDLARLSSIRELGECFPPPLPLAQPPDHHKAGDRLLVLDLGWAATSTMGEASWVTTLLGSAELVVVTRLTVPGVRQTEQLLSSLPVPAVLALVGSGRWSGEVAASCGPAIRAGRDSGRAVMIPTDRRLEISGLTADPLPRSVAAAGRALAARLSPERLTPPGMPLPRPKEF
ncbi:MAG: hypothetical protein M3400_15885 [Actinomycetota bacterium]|nr:hypothetical protein [Actinomycetota bacterium]